MWFESVLKSTGKKILIIPKMCCKFLVEKMARKCP